MRKLFAIVGVTAIILGGLFAGLTAPAFAQGTTNVPGSNKYHQVGQVDLITRTEDDSRVPLFDKDPSTLDPDPIVLRTSTTGDLIIELHAECFITVTGDTGNVAVRVHVEVDDQPVPVADETVDVGKVNFCDRHLDDPGNVTDTTSKTAGFKWVAFNVGNGEHTVQAFAEFTVSSGEATIGRRLIQIFTTTTQQN
jgi:hypothetical protein